MNVNEHQGNRRDSGQRSRSWSLTPAHTTAQYILRNTQTHIHTLLIQILYRIKWQHPDQIIQISLFFNLLLACASTSLLPCFHSFAAVSPLSQQSSILTANFNALHDSVHVCCCRIAPLLVPNCFHLFTSYSPFSQAVFFIHYFEAQFSIFPGPHTLRSPPSPDEYAANLCQLHECLF